MTWRFLALLELPEMVLTQLPLLHEDQLALIDMSCKQIDKKQLICSDAVKLLLQATLVLRGETPLVSASTKVA